MLVFATSDKGGTGRSVTSSNLMYRLALAGRDVCYLDFDFGSPTAGAMFSIPNLDRGTTKAGLHTYLLGEVTDPQSIDVWATSDRESLRSQPPGAGRLVLYPGDNGGGEFSITPEMIDRCIDLFLRLEEEFDVSLVDLSSGRSYAIEMALAATAHERLSHVVDRWLIFHRWTRQHILAASNLVFGDQGVLHAGHSIGHDEEELRSRIRFVRTAVQDPNGPELNGLRAEQIAWLHDFDLELRKLAQRNSLGRTMVLGSVPLDPVLQWREQIITDIDANVTKVANTATVAAFTELAERVIDPAPWAGL